MIKGMLMKNNEMLMVDNASRVMEAPHIDPSELRALFKLFVGQPDSSTKIFTRDVKVDLNDLMLLNERMKEKLENYQKTAVEISIDVKFENNTFKTFTDWFAFEGYNWQVADIIDTISVRWDFLIKLPNYDMPQRHTVLVRISSGLKLHQLLQVLMSGNIDNVDSIDQNLAPVICKVDFVNHLLADELINLVAEWNKGLKEADEINNKLLFVKQHPRSIVFITRNLMPLMAIIVLIAGFNSYLDYLKIATLAEMTIQYIQNIAIYVTVSCITYNLVKVLGQMLTRSVIESASNYGEIRTFNITRGDINRQEKLDKKNEKYVQRVHRGIGLTIIINILCGVISTILYNYCSR